MKGGVFGAAKRALAGESVFLNTTGRGPQRLDIAPGSPGDMVHIPMNQASSRFSEARFARRHPV